MGEAFTAAQLAQIIRALQQVLLALQPGAAAQVAEVEDPMEKLNEALRKVRIEGVTPLDVSDQGGAYRAWVLGIERNLFRKHRLLEVITGEFACPAGAAHDPAVTDWQVRNNAAVSILLSAMTQALRERISPTHTAAEIWALLRANGTSYTAESLHALLSNWVDMHYHEDEEDIGGFWAKFTGVYDQLREPLDAQGQHLYGITPFMLLGQLLHALPASWDEVARDLRALPPDEVNLDDIYRRLRAFEMNNKARQEMGTANRAGGVPNKSGNTPPPGGKGGKTPEQPCSYCKRGVHAVAKCFSKIRDEYLRQYPGAPAPALVWLLGLVNAGFQSPVPWASALQHLGQPPPAAPRNPG